MFKRIKTIYRYLLHKASRLTTRQLMMVLACVVGLVAGLGTYVFEMLLYGIKQGLVSWFKVNSASVLYLIYPVVGVIIATLFVKYVVKDQISEGVTRVLYAMSKTGSKIKPHNCWTPIVGGAATIGFGGSVGPEAPIVLAGAAMGSNIGRMLKLNYKQITLLLCCGAGAALAAIFKAPIAGVVFVFEILMFDITAGSVVPLLIATVSATTLSFFLRGFDPILAVTVPDAFQFRNLPMYILLGVMCGFMSYYFTTVNSRVSAFFSGKSMYMKWLIAGVVLGVLIFVFPPLYGEGYSSFTDLMNGRIEPLFDNSLFYDYRNITWVVILYLIATPFLKVVAMAATNAAGGVGGTFAPSLFVGAYLGAIVAYTCNTFLGMHLPLISFALVGMAGVMSGVMKAPLTSIFLIAELSNGYGLFVPLMLVSSISFALDYYLDPDSIYTKQLRQRGELLTHNKDQSVLVFLNLDKLMETDFVPLTASTTLGDLVKIIETARRNIFPVLDSNGELLGVVQLDDLREDMFNVQKYGAKITEYMIPPPDKILPNQHMQSVLDSFEESGTWMLPVVDKNNRYMGFISKSRILAAYRQQLMDISQ